MKFLLTLLLLATAGPAFEEGVRTAADDRIPFGSAVNEKSLFGWSSIPQDSADYRARLKELFTWGVPANTGKMSRMHSDGRYQYYWTDLDAMFSWFEANRMHIKYHCVVWDNNANPAWYTALPALEKRAALEEHVRAIVGRYAGRVSMYDMINEPYNQGSDTDYMSTGWTKTEALVNILTWARAEDPAALLLINEFDLIQVPGTRQGFIDLINAVKAAAGPVDGIGVQAHLGVNGRPGPCHLPADSVITGALDQLAAQTGLPLYISEFTVCTPGMQLEPCCAGNPDDPFDGYDSWWHYQAWAYPHAYQVFMSVSAVKMIVMWGFNDIWEPGHGLFDEQFTPKPVYATLAPILTGSSGIDNTERDGLPAYSGEPPVQVAPNPFYTVTDFIVTAPQNGGPAGDIVIRLYNSGGALVTTLAATAPVDGRTFRIAWPGNDDNGRRLEKGIYLYEVSTGMSRQTGRIMFAR